MKNDYFLKLIGITFIGALGGYLFSLMNLPLPWVLGALTFVIIWKGFTKRTTYWPNSLKNSGFLVLGIYA